MKVIELEKRGRFHAIELGPKTGRPLLWLHGFPDHPPTAVPFLEHFTRTHRVTAPWLRGYAPSPLDGRFELEELAADAIALIDSISPDGAPVDVIGHDWGAAITYAVCAIAPARVRRAVTLAFPHPLTFMRRLQTPAQMRRSWYMALFQIPGAERLVRANDFALVDHLWRTWSPGLELDETCRKKLHACLADSLPAPLWYYRSIVRPFAHVRKRIAAFSTPLDPPVLQLHGEDDGCILPPTDEDSRRFSRREIAVIPACGHFLHLEAPAPVAARIETWLS